MIVDDEKLELEAIKHSADFFAMGVSEVLEAYNIRQAKEFFLKRKVDILLCDIEMPQGSGLELLEWVGQFFPNTQCIIITCHEDFSYIKRAIQLGSLDYILKPVQEVELKRVICKAVNNIYESRELEEKLRFSKLWVKHQPFVIEQFWSYILNRKIMSKDEFQKAAEENGFPGIEDLKVFPFLIHIQRWCKEIDFREEKMIEFKVKNYVRELILKQPENGAIIEMGQGFLLGLIYLDSNDIDPSSLSKSCDDYISVCRQNTGCDLSCYIGSPVFGYRLVEEVEKLLSYGRNNVIYINQVFTLQQLQQEVLDSDAFNLTNLSSLANVSDTWLAMLVRGERNELLDDIDKLLQNLEKERKLNINTINQILHCFTQTVNVFLENKGIQAYELFGDDQSTKLFTQANRSVWNMKDWMTHVVDKLYQCTEYSKLESVIEKVKRYISLNIDKDLTCKQIANQVFLHPNYLNRIFKRKMGISLSTYLLQERIMKAKELLSNTDIPVSLVAAFVGYTNFSHFSRLFKKYVGVTPKEYRKKFYDAGRIIMIPENKTDKTNKIS